MGKLGLHHKGEIMLYALQQGYVSVTSHAVHYPGFQRRLQGTNGEGKDAPQKRASGE